MTHNVNMIKYYFFILQKKKHILINIEFYVDTQICVGSAANI